MSRPMRLGCEGIHILRGKNESDRTVTMALLRKAWFRLIIVALILVIVNVILANFLADSSSASLRVEAIKALQGATILFAISAALSIALFSNYVKGIRERYLDRVSNIRDLLEKFFDEHRSTGDPDIQDLLDDFVLPLLSLGTNAWVTFDPIRNISEKIVDPATRIHARDDTFLPRYLLRIEDEIDELGVLYIRGIITGLHLKTISGAILLIASGIISLGFSYLIPNGPINDLLVINISITIITFAVLELLLILSYLQQEGREEQPGRPNDNTGV